MVSIILFIVALNFLEIFFASQTIIPKEGEKKKLLYEDFLVGIKIRQLHTKTMQNTKHKYLHTMICG